MVLSRWEMGAAGQARALFLGSGEDDPRERGEHGHHPGDPACHHSKGDRPGLYGKHGVDDRQVPVNGQEDDEEDAREEAYVVEPRQNLTQPISKDPLICGVVGPERDGEKKEQVGDGQIEQVDVSHALQPFAIDEDEDDQHVAHETKDEHQRVERRQKPNYVLSHADLLTGHAIIIVIIGGGFSIAGLDMGCKQRMRRGLHVVAGLGKCAIVTHLSPC
ncbi:unnamed protein product, partial [Gulo gulo]